MVIADIWRRIVLLKSLENWKERYHQVIRPDWQVTPSVICGHNLILGLDPQYIRLFNLCKEQETAMTNPPLTLYLAAPRRVFAPVWTRRHQDRRSSPLRNWGAPVFVRNTRSCHNKFVVDGPARQRAVFRSRNWMKVPATVR